MVAPPKKRAEASRLSEATRTALFIYASAGAAGFRFRAAEHGKLEIVGPVGEDPELCEPVIAAIRKHGSEIQRLIRWLASEERQGRFWSPRREPGGRQ